MSDPFVAEIRIVGFNFAPTGWALCDGQIMPISQNTALFSLLGTTYGGDGKSTFALPNLQGTFPMGPGQGPGLSLRDLGETGGASTVALLETEIPVHTHTLSPGATGGTATVDPSNALLGASPTRPYAAGSTPSVSGAAMGTALVGSGLPHNNMPPYLTLNFVIALRGVFPARS